MYQDNHISPAPNARHSSMHPRTQQEPPQYRMTSDNLQSSYPSTGGLDKDQLITTTQVDSRTESAMSGNRATSVNVPRRSKKQGHKFKDYFEGPRDPMRHSKFPLFMRLHGSILPKMIFPLFFVAAWSVGMAYVYIWTDVEFDTTLLTVLGFLVSLSISFRVSSGFALYMEGRRAWSQLTHSSRILARIIWIHIVERDDTDADCKEDLMGKITAINMISAFSIALKHHLRFEPATTYADLAHLIGHLDKNTMATHTDQIPLQPVERGFFRMACEYLGITFTQENPRKTIKQCPDNLGNLPNEIITYIAAYIQICTNNKTLPVPFISALMTEIKSLTDVLATTERIARTGMPLAYSVTIQQIVWIYLTLLPFQFFKQYGWFSVLFTFVAAYIMLGMAMIGQEVEQPFGTEVNDLPLDIYCEEIAADLDVLTSMPAPTSADFIQRAENKLMYPYSLSPWSTWKDQSVKDIRAALKERATSNATANRFEEVKVEGFVVLDGGRGTV